MTVAPPTAAVATASGGRQVGSSRLGLRGSGGGEIVEVQGGHIVRSTGRKDRHSKVCTAKGPRDRRVRLSAHTAIQFYDVQDRLGYDRPSKAVDWLIKKAKSAIDELAQLPAWHPTASCPENLGNSASNKRATMSSMLANEAPQQLNNTNNNNSSSSFLPPSMDSDSIADTIKSFFPLGASGEANSSAMQFQSFPPPDLLSRTSSHSQNQDLRLSLQSFQDPFHQHPQHHHSMYSTASQMGFDVSAPWPEQHQHQQQQRMGGGGWSSGGDAPAGGGGYLFNAQAAAAAPQPFLQQLFGQNQLFTQRGPLQSSSTPSIRAWMDPSSVSIASSEQHHPMQQQHHHHQAAAAFLPVYPSSLSSFGFASGVGGFSGFRIPARIQGDEEEHDGISDKPSSASSDSRH